MSILKFARQGILLKGSKQSATLSEAGTKGRSTSVRSCARLLKSEEGGPIIEFAFVLPFMMVCLTGIFTFGAAIYNALVLTQATGAGAQYLQTDRGASDPCAATIGAIEAAAPNLKPSSITLSISINGGTAVTAQTCTSQSTALSNAQGEPVTVTTKYPCSMLVYGLNLGSCQLSAQSTEYEY
jgi:Flp pilus assembly protein TadG